MARDVLRSLRMLLLVMVRDVPVSNNGECARQRTAFLRSLVDQGRLLLEASVGDSGSLMVLEAISVEEAVDLLQNDPFILLSSDVQIRPLTINVVRFDGRTASLVNSGAESASGTRRERKRLHGQRAANGSAQHPKA